MQKYICIHGHFYQPPRENPWLETIELQESAYPFHDWNERINAECYAPNAASRIFDAEGCIDQIVNNYAKISFNFGPTLLAWMQDKQPETYAAIREADRESRANFGGHGNAIAQCYNHMIMPLANSRDKQSQVTWGIRDFEFRFGRAPEGMWLPETAVDLESLDMMAAQGIKFTILSPFQATRIRRIQDTPPPAPPKNGEEGDPAEDPNPWQDALGGKIDPTRPYLQRLPSGRTITIFFYDGPISQTIAFGDTLDRGENFAHRLTGAFNDGRDWPQIVHIATDGETYGHHHHFGDMALAYALNFIETNNLATITNYAEYLEQHPPEWEVEVTENTAWSCSHGVGRWKENCGCNSGGHAGWNQEWRAPLRAALDWLRDELAPRYEEEGRKYLKDPWAARDDYVDVILDRTRTDEFFEKHASRPLSDGEKIRALKLLELQRHAMLMYTSCGWFFDELSGIETVQVIQYAARALQLANTLFSGNLEPEFLTRLSAAHSNIPENGDGRNVFEKFVRPAEVDLQRVAAHYAVSSLFETYPDESRIYAFDVDCGDLQRMEAGVAKLLISHARFTSDITYESKELSFGVLFLGDQNLSGGVRDYTDPAAYDALVKEARESFDRGDMSDVLRILDQHYTALTFSLESLFKDEQQKAITEILQPALDETRAGYRRIYDQRAPFLRFLGAIHHPIPPELITAAGFALNSELFRAIYNDPTDIAHFGQLMEQARRLSVILDAPGLAYAMSKVIDEQADAVREHPEEVEGIERESRMVEAGELLPALVNLWHAQNLYFDMLGDVYPAERAKSDAGDEEGAAWVRAFLDLGSRLKVTAPKMQPAASKAAAIKVVK